MSETLKHITATLPLAEKVNIDKKNAWVRKQLTALKAQISSGTTEESETSDALEFLKNPSDKELQNILASFQNAKFKKHKEWAPENSSQAIYALQMTLNRFGYSDSKGNTLQVNGIFGPKTKDALKRFQTLNDCEAKDGIPGPETFEKMQNILAPNEAGKFPTRFHTESGMIRLVPKTPTGVADEKHRFYRYDSKNPAISLTTYADGSYIIGEDRDGKYFNATKYSPAGKPIWKWKEWLAIPMYNLETEKILQKEWRDRDGFRTTIIDDTNTVIEIPRADRDQRYTVSPENPENITKTYLVFTHPKDSIKEIIVWNTGDYCIRDRAPNDKSVEYHFDNAAKKLFQRRGSGVYLTSSAR